MLHEVLHDESYLQVKNKICGSYAQTASLEWNRADPKVTKSLENVPEEIWHYYFTISFELERNILVTAPLHQFEWSKPYECQIDCKSKSKMFIKPFTNFILTMMNEATYKNIRI